MWDYLDKMDKNVLYTYAALLSANSRHHFEHLHSRVGKDEELTEKEIHEREVSDRNVRLYLVWFVYRYILGCRTLDEALVKPVDEVFGKYKLKQIVFGKQIYIGIDGDIPLYREEDVPIILEILYKRLGFWEQLDLFIEKGGKNGKKSIRQTRCLEAKKRYMALLSASGQEMMQG